MQAEKIANFDGRAQLVLFDMPRVPLLSDRPEGFGFRLDRRESASNAREGFPSPSAGLLDRHCIGPPNSGPDLLARRVNRDRREGLAAGRLHTDVVPPQLGIGVIVATGADRKGRDLLSVNLLRTRKPPLG